MIGALRVAAHPALAKGEWFLGTGERNEPPEQISKGTPRFGGLGRCCKPGGFWMYPSRALRLQTQIGDEINYHSKQKHIKLRKS